MRCPCRKCLIEPICKDPCPDFSKFIKPIDRGCEFLEKFFEIIDDQFKPGSTPDRVYNWVGENIISPAIFYPIKFIYGIKTNTEELTLFDERFDVWERRDKVKDETTSL